MSTARTARRSGLRVGWAVAGGLVACLLATAPGLAAEFEKPQVVRIDGRLPTSIGGRGGVLWLTTAGAKGPAPGSLLGGVLPDGRRLRGVRVGTTRIAWDGRESWLVADSGLSVIAPSVTALRHRGKVLASPRAPSGGAGNVFNLARSGNAVWVTGGDCKSEESCFTLLTRFGVSGGPGIGLRTSGEAEVAVTSSGLWTVGQSLGGAPQLSLRDERTGAVRTRRRLPDGFGAKRSPNGVFAAATARTVWLSDVDGRLLGVGPGARLARVPTRRQRAAQMVGTSETLWTVSTGAPALIGIDDRGRVARRVDLPPLRFRPGVDSYLIGVTTNSIWVASTGASRLVRIPRRA